MSINSVYLIGRVGKDPETRYVSEGTRQVTTFSIAVRGWSKDQTDWFNLEMWDKTAEIASKYVRKGSQVGIEGHLRVESYEKDGQRKIYTKIVVSQLELLGGRKERQSGAQEHEMEAF